MDSGSGFFECCFCGRLPRQNRLLQDSLTPKKQKKDTPKGGCDELMGDSLRPPTAVVVQQTDSPGCGRATAVASVHRTLAKSRLSNPVSSPTTKKTNTFWCWSFLWWGRTDSNHRSETQQIYSLSPLATRELPHILFSLSKQNMRIISWNLILSRTISDFQRKVFRMR